MPINDSSDQLDLIGFLVLKYLIMKKILFRIVELENYQVLISKDFDSENDNEPLLINIVFFIDNIKITQVLAYTDEVIRDNMFLQITEEQIKSIVDNALKMWK